MAESTTQNASIALYHYLCQNIVGSEKNVTAFRLMNNVRDNLNSDEKKTLITSGSFGEGLLMRGSDFDIMHVLKQIEVSEDTPVYFNAKKIHFTMELEDTQPCFTKLRLVQSNDLGILKDCYVVNSHFFFSNISFRRKFASFGNDFSTIHGPCVSDAEGLFDFAFCLHCKLWITSAKQWVIRSNRSWPSYDVKQDIVKHGVLFVPIGVKGSTQEELEWRISFSVGEKFLIYSFTHTQLLCYALMKILLKDVIALDIDCKELLCSYFMKTILFWMCEELPLSIWKPENLISCFMRCLRRLIYCVEYSLCPHYFIPEYNLFENKIMGQAQKSLLNKLYILNSYGWKCILLSDQFSNLNALASGKRKETSYSYANSVERLLNSFMFYGDSLGCDFYFLLEKVIYMVLSSKSSKIKYLYTYYLSKFCCNSCLLLSLEDMSCNKSTYYEYQTHISTLCLNIHHDAVSGWLRFSSFFYNRKQYNTALHIIQYSLFKCSPEKLHESIQFSDIHYELLNLDLFRKISFVQLCKFLLVGLVFIDNSTLYPNELQMVESCIFPPVVYAHFLRLLCHYHLKNSRQCWDSIRDLQLTIEENYLVQICNLESLSYKILCIGFVLLGDKEAARLAFIHSIQLFSDQ